MDLSTATEVRQLVAITSRHLEHLLAARIVILLGTPETWAREELAPSEAKLAEKAWSRREQISDGGESRGSLWAPLIGLNAQVGVVGVIFAQRLPSDPAQSFLVTACGNQFVSAMERVRLANAVHRTELEAETERLRNSLLSAVSHDLKTPLTSIIAAGSTLLSGSSHTPETQRDLVAAMVGEGERLHRLINNLLSAARLDAPSVELRRSTESIEEIVAASTARFRNAANQSSISLNLEPNLPFIYAEPRLLEQVLVNLIENAQRYAEKRVNIAIHVKSTEHGVAVKVSDDGPGIPEDERDKVFEKFYRGQRAGKGDGGVGLGLTICRAIVRAHGGRIAIGANGDAGTSVEFTLPSTEAVRGGGAADSQSKLAS